MGRVRILERSVAERIAAGEVVERPASVAKELVENSLDAGASRVTVELEAGGVRLLRVTDDGCGMSADDARLALERFATSKIEAWEDLDRLGSLGFRGEALPSIAAVSRLEILTCEPGAQVGTRLVVEGGELVEEAPAPAPPGTRVTVRDLFFNTPARRKFLRSPAAETSAVLELVGRLAVARPEVHFRLLSQGREILAFPASLGLPDRLAWLWRIPARDLVEVEGEWEGVRARGLVALPARARPNRSAQIFVLNGRLIRSPALSQALLEGYGPLLPQGRFPAGLVRLDLDPALVDVNVHPTKAEVRFARPQAPFRAVHRAVAAALERAGADTVDLEALVRAQEPPAGWGNPPAPAPWGPAPGPQEAPAGPEEPARVREEPALVHPEPARVREEPALYGPLRAPTAAYLDLFRPGDAPEVPSFEPLAQLHRTYIVALVAGELWLVDQHTAHERIHYERLGHLSPLGGRCQGLLAGHLVELDPVAGEFLAGHLEDFEALGFEVEPFGGHCFHLRGVPAGLPQKRVVAAFRDLVLEAAQGGAGKGPGTPEAFRERLRAMVACKSSVRAGDPLTFEEMRQLGRQLLEVERSRYCPHGRPTRVILGPKTLERLFHR